MLSKYTHVCIANHQFSSLLLLSFLLELVSSLLFSFVSFSCLLLFSALLFLDALPLLFFLSFLFFFFFFFFLPLASSSGVTSDMGISLYVFGAFPPYSSHSCSSAIISLRIGSYSSGPLTIWIFACVFGSNQLRITFQAMDRKYGALTTTSLPIRSGKWSESIFEMRYKNFEDSLVKRPSRQCFASITVVTCSTMCPNRLALALTSCMKPSICHR
mmetsp:Transcript_7240/g.13487  ORF Transcript_7240/g.13487 Transcript_7240/m.13487 type:complete len:215 (+) Transcript_7240:143-787(+)